MFGDINGRVGLYFYVHCLVNHLELFVLDCADSKVCFGVDF